MHSEIFDRAGYVILPSTFDSRQIQSIEMSLNAVTHEATGTRCMLGHDWCAQLASSIRRNLEDEGILPRGYVAVQCTYFEKSRNENWLVAVHQDLSIPVQRRIEHPDLNGWSEKERTTFVQPPVEFLERLIAARLHIDDCREEDGALRVVPGSHLRGRLKNTEALVMRDEIGEQVCPVSKGGMLVMRPLLLHASSKSTGSSRRRVLHFVFGPAELPHGLSWAYAI